MLIPPTLGPRRRRTRAAAMALGCAVLVGAAAAATRPLSAAPTRGVEAAAAEAPPGARGALDALEKSTSALLAQAPRLKPSVARLALNATQCAASQGLVTKPYLTVIDYSVASTKPRLWVFDLRTQRLLFEELVAHGKNSGGDRTSRFSNELGSLQSSLGLFVTSNPYVGENGYSLRLRGLEEGFNDRALVRAIVMHGAAYVNTAAAKVMGRLGRSYGCPAVRPAVARSIIDTIQGGSAVFAYYPDRGWLGASNFAGRCN